MKKLLAIVISIGLTAGLSLAMGGAALGAAATDLTLADGVKLALENNRDVKIAAKDREAAYWKLREAKADRYPVLDLTHTDTRVKPDPSDPAYVLTGTTPPGATDYFDNKFTVSLPIYTGGQLGTTIEQLELNLKIADLNLNRIQQQTTLNATVAYFDVLHAQSMVQLCAETVDSFTAHLHNVQAFMDAGIVTKSDLLRTQVEVANAAENLIKAKNGYDLALANLNNILGLPLSSALNVKENLAYVQYDNSLENCTQSALEKRPEIAMANLNSEIAKKGIDLAKSGYWPTVSLVGIMDMNDTDFLGTKNNNWSVNLISSWKLNTGGQTQAKVSQARTSQEKAAEVAAQVQEGISLEVRQAYLSLKEAEQRMQTNRLVVDAANEDVRLNQLRYQAGMETNLNVIDAQLALTKAKTNYISSMYDYNVSMAKLQKAIGM